MAGKKCPQCGKNTFFLTSTGRKCSNTECGFTMTVPANSGKGGRGKKCSYCQKYTVFNNKCRNENCGAVYK